MAPGNKTHVRLREDLAERLSNLALPEAVPKNLVSDQPAGVSTGSVSDQPVTNTTSARQRPTMPLRSLTDTQCQIVRMCDVFRSRNDLMAKLGMTHRTFFGRKHLEPLIDGGVLQMRHPDQPNHPQQAYILTTAGAAIAELLAKHNSTEGGN